MPPKVTTTAGGDVYESPFVGPVDFVTVVLVDLSTLSTDEVDADGVLKPGVLLKDNGALADATAGEFIYGAVAEATKVADDNSNLAGETDVEVAVCTIGQVNRAILEDVLGRALTANEVSAIKAAGSGLVLVE